MEPPEPVSGQIISLTAGISLRREVPAFFVPFSAEVQLLRGVVSDVDLLPVLVITNTGNSLP